MLRLKDGLTVDLLLILLADHLEPILLAMRVLLDGKQAVSPIPDDAQLFLHYY